MNSDSDVVIIGAGHNGLVAAGYLARAGLRVTVLERREIVGGAVTTEELIPGFHFSACSFLCYALQPKIVQELEMRRYGFEVFQLDPLEFRPFPDGRSLILHRDQTRNIEAIRRHSVHDAEAYARWTSFWKKAAQIINPYRLRTPPTIGQLFADVRGTDSEPILDRLVTTSFSELVTEWFESDVVRAAFMRSGGVGDPREIGSSYPSADLAGGEMDVSTGVGNIVGIVKGGMGSITRALAASAEAHGVVIRKNAEVRRIAMRGGIATGVEMADGVILGAKIVISNADPKRTFLGLVGRERLPGDFAERVQRLTTAVSFLKLHAALRELPDFSRWLGANHDPKMIARIWINPSVEYYEQAWRDAANGIPSRAPVMSIQIPSIYDPSVAPPGKHVLSIFAKFAPVRPAAGSWDELRQSAGENLIRTVNAFAPNFLSSIIDWKLFTPADLERRVGLTDGNIHHLDMRPSQLFASRPLAGWANYRTPIPGLWLCGAGTHPGGEVTGMPGHNAAHEILRSMGHPAKPG